MEKYPTELVLQPYEDNLEYRKQFRQLTSMDSDVCESNVQEKNHNNNLDEETIDEEFYDEKAVSRFIDFLLLHTEKNALFQTIYYKAANQMLSEDYGIGITILLSYDYLFEFHVCLVDYFQNKNEFESSNPNYQKLLTLL